MSRSSVPEPYVYDLIWNRVFADVIQLETWRRDRPLVPGAEREAGQKDAEKETEGGAIGCQPGRSQDAGKGMGRVSPEPPERLSPVPALTGGFWPLRL